MTRRSVPLSEEDLEALFGEAQRDDAQPGPDFLARLTTDAIEQIETRSWPRSHVETVSAPGWGARLAARAGFFAWPAALAACLIIGIGLGNWADQNGLVGTDTFLAADAALAVAAQAPGLSGLAGGF